MKKHALTMSVAVLSAAFLLGCQDQGSGPVGPEALGPEFHVSAKHPDGHGGGDGGGDETTATVVLATGMETAVPQMGLKIQVDSKKKLEVFGEARVETALINTRALMPPNIAEVGIGAMCKVDPPDAADTQEGRDLVQDLANELVEPAKAIFSLAITVDKTGLTVGGGLTTDKDHKVVLNYTDTNPGLGLMNLRVGTSGLAPEFRSPRVDFVSEVGTTRVFEFSDGAAVVWRREGGPREQITLVCPNVDIIEVAITTE